MGGNEQRGIDVDVILDLMIHDIDIVLNLVASPVTEIRANGVSVLSSHIDIANARLEFKNQCVANLTASRVSIEQLRKIRIFQPDAYLTLDYQRQQLLIFRRISDLKGWRIVRQEPSVEKKEPLRGELEEFVRSVCKRVQPTVSAEEARESLRLALEIRRVSQEKQQSGEG